MVDEKRSSKLARVAFGDAYRDGRAEGVQRKVVIEGPSSSIDELIERFEDACHFDDDGNEYWFARDLQGLLEYTKWDNFLSVVDRARLACEQAGHKCDDHFAGVGKMVNLGSGAEREIEDIVLSRYAAYMVAQNADGRKKSVAFAQTYFAIQTRRQEAADQEDSDYKPLSEDEKRCLLRDEIKEHNKNLASAAKNAGVREGLDFAIFQTEGYKGLYGGLDVPGIRRRKKLTAKQHILDHMGSTELAANLFRATQTEEKLRRDNIQGRDAANKTHFDIGRKVRETIADIGGAMPETLPAAEDVKKVERRLKRVADSATKRIGKD